MSVYLDHAATTPVRPESLNAYLEAQSHFGNPSSVHAQGRQTREILEQAREVLAEAVGCHRSEVIFTSGGTESDNQLIKGLYWSRQDRPRKYIVSALSEHHALLDPIHWLEKHEGAHPVWLTVDKTGQPDFAQFQQLIEELGDEIALVSLMWVNNETGALIDLQKFSALAGQRNIPVHSDAVATFGHLPFKFSETGLTAMSISGHKLGAPIGIGASIIARSAKPVSLIHGGGQERGLRSGTMNYPLAMAFAQAASAAVSDQVEREHRLGAMRDRLERELLKTIPAVSKTISGPRIEHTASFLFPGAQSDSLLFLLDQKGLCVSAGSACQAGVLGASHVLLAMGYSEAEASSVLRISLGHSSTEADVDTFLGVIEEVYSTALRAGLNR